VRVQKASLHDVNALSVLFNDYRQFYEMPADLEGARKFLSDRITNNESVIFLARAGDGNVTGFVQLYPIFSSTRMKRLWLLNDLFVVHSCRGTGTSVGLVEAAKQFARETLSCGLVLETAKLNVVANKFYKRIGFTLDSDHNFYAWNE
jgi:GNAT superfamily N-acetyltransferase